MSTPRPKTQTFAQFLADLESKNLTLADWARQHDFNVTTVYAISAGRLRGRRGHARDILKAMGVALPPMSTSRLAQRSEHVA